MKKIKVFILSIILLIIILLGTILIKTKAAENVYTGNGINGKLQLNDCIVLDTSTSYSDNYIINFYFDSLEFSNYINNEIFEKNYLQENENFFMRVFFEINDTDNVSTYFLEITYIFIALGNGNYDIEDIGLNYDKSVMSYNVTWNYNDTSTSGNINIITNTLFNGNLMLSNVLIDTNGLIETFTMNEFICNTSIYTLNKELEDTQKELEDTYKELYDLQNQVDHWEFDKQVMQEHIAQLEADKTALEAQVLELTKSLEIRYKEGYLNGYNYAYEKAKEEAQKDIDKAYQDGKVVGYNEGVNVALENTPALKWVGAFIAASTAILDVKVGSVSIGTLVMIPLSISIVAFIIKMWKGGQEG